MRSIFKIKAVSILQVFFVLLIFSIIIPLFPLQNPLQIDLSNRFSPPSYQFLLGTDELGRDMLSRLLHGAATTISISIFALISSLGIGIFVGAFAGYFYQTWFDKAFNWLVSLFFTLPFLLVMVSLLSLMEQNIFNAYLILTLIMWVNPARIVRAEVIRIRKLPYVRAFKSLGASELHVLFYAVLPGCVNSSITFSLSYFPEIVGLEAGLSFLGLGVQPPHPGLGKMIFDGINYLYSAWWISIVPAVFLAMIVLTVNKCAKIWH